MMKLFSRTSEERNHYFVLAAVFCAAFAVRLTAVFLTIDVPGDGLARATRAYVWSQSPFLRSHGHWLRGYEYLGGMLGSLLGDPLLSSRLLNALLGSLTILLFYYLIRKMYDTMNALISTSLLAFFPLHIGLSASSLTEVSFAFEIISGTLFLVMAAEAEAPKNRAFYTVASLSFLCLAAMTRYEAWVLIPVFPLYYFRKTRGTFASVLILAVLSVFPLIWTLNNYLYADAPFRGFTGATGWQHGAQSANVVFALRLLIAKSINQLGWIVPVLAAAGITLQFFEAVKRNVDAKKMLYIVIACIFWSGVLVYALARGAALYDRLLLFAFILALPFAALSLTYFVRRYKRRSVMISLLTVAVLLSVVYKPGVYKSLSMPGNQFYVTLWRPTEMKNLADWLKNSPYRESSFLMTPIQGRSSYLFYYYPEASARRLVVKYYSKDSDIERFLKTRKPALLITCDDNREALSRIENVLGTKIGEDMLIHTEEYIKVYNINPVVNSMKY